ncbi:transposase [Streptomyces sp. NPDC008121]|uniref:transposase n=1 Tax=Streptomyces sp. NPDC008121 TaxID=3364809 RepID=UPI0036E240A3
MFRQGPAGRSSGRTVTEVARELGVSAEGLRGWVKQAAVDRGEGPAGALATAEREELVRLRRKVREQEQAVEVLGKATAFFANRKTKQSRATRSSTRRRRPRSPLAAAGPSRSCAGF